MPIITFPKGLKCLNIPDGTYMQSRQIAGSMENIEVLSPFVVKDSRLYSPVELKARWRSSNDMRNFFANGCQPTKAKINGMIEEIYFEGDRFMPYIKKTIIEKLPTLYLENKRGRTDLDKLKLNSFDFPKSVGYIEFLVSLFTEKCDIVLDFFSGSATTAHAVMQLNAEDGGKRKFIMVQLPERTDEKSEAYKAGYKNICEIGKERIRRAGKKILNELGVRNDELGIENGNDKLGVGNDDNPQFRTPNSKLDIGFRVLKLDESNMKDIYYTPAETPIDAQQEMAFDSLVDNIREGRTAEDLLFQVLPECNLPLSSKIEERELYGKHVFVVNDGYLVACFDSDINEAVITAIAKQRPYYFVMCDRSMATDNVADNFDQIFDAYSKETIRRVL